MAKRDGRNDPAQPRIAYGEDCWRLMVDYHGVAYWVVRLNSGEWMEHAVDAPGEVKQRAIQRLIEELGDRLAGIVARNEE